MARYRRGDGKRGHFCRPADAVPPRQTNSSERATDDEGRERRSMFEEWNAISGVYECRGGVSEEWIASPRSLTTAMKYVEVQACLWHPWAENLWGCRGKFQTARYNVCVDVCVSVCVCGVLALSLFLAPKSFGRCKNYYDSWSVLCNAKLSDILFGGSWERVEKSMNVFQRDA